MENTEKTCCPNYEAECKVLREQCRKLEEENQGLMAKCRKLYDDNQYLVGYKAAILTVFGGPKKC